jgi:hypothetical protein
MSIEDAGRTKCCNAEMWIVVVSKDVAKEGAKAATYRPPSAQGIAIGSIMDAECPKLSDVGFQNVNAPLDAAGRPAAPAIHRSYCISGAQGVVNIGGTDCLSFNNATVTVVNATMGAVRIRAVFAPYRACWNVRGDSLPRPDPHRLPQCQLVQFRVFQFSQRKSLPRGWGKQGQRLERQCLDRQSHRRLERQGALEQGLQVVRGRGLQPLQGQELLEGWIQDFWRGWHYQD